MAAAKTSSTHGSCRLPVLAHSARYSEFADLPDSSLGVAIPSRARSAAVAFPTFGMSVSLWASEAINYTIEVWRGAGVDERGGLENR